MRKLMLSVLALATLAGCSSEPASAPEPQGFDMKVQLTIAPGHTQRLARGCEGKPLVRVPENTPVLVRDSGGTTIGAGQLATGIVQPDGACILTAEVPVNQPSDFYEITFGTREPVTMPANLLVDNQLSMRVGYSS